MKKLAFSIAKSRTKFLLLLLVIEMIILSCISPYFFNMNNLLQVTQFGATLTLLSLGEALVMISGRDGIDISIGSTMSLSGVIFGLAVMNGANIPIAAFITLLGGVVFGAVNGVLVAVAKVPALIATLGTQYIYSSLALYLTGGIPISGFPDSFALLSLKSTFGIPNQILFVVIPVSVLIFILVYKMKFGRRVYLMGTNPEAAKYAGIREMKVRAMVYVLAGVLASVSAIINNSWLMTARADAGSGTEMQAITVAVLGGIGVAGGTGHLGGVLIGVVIITMLNSGLQIANVNSVWQLAALGLILIAAIILNQLMSRFVKNVEKVKNNQEENDMKKVLLAGESWMSYTTHVKGFDSFYTSVYETGEKWLKKALEENGYDVEFLPNHLAAEKFPYTMEELKTYSCVILSDIGANTLMLPSQTFTKSIKMPDRTKVIRDYVMDGGALLMIGGYLTFSGVDAKGKWHDTAVQEVLPVEVLTVDDRKEHCDGISPVVVKDHVSLKGIPEKWPDVLGYNKTIPKPEAEVAVMIGDDPLVAFSEYGKGKSAVFTSDCAPHWAPPEFCEWEGYAKIWKGIMDWLTR